MASYELPPPAKRLKVSSAPIPCVCEDALVHVMGYLAPRELFRIAFTCKFLRDRVTTSLVVRSAMIHGGHARRTIEVLYPIMKRSSIHVPSPCRLLRLVNGRICEHKNCRRKVNFVRPDFGVFLCWYCLTEEKCGTTYQWNIKSEDHEKRKDRYDVVFSHPRINPKRQDNNRFFVWENRIVVGEKGEEPVGPIVTRRDIIRMASSRNTMGIDHYLQHRLNAPALKKYKEFIDTYESVKNRADQKAWEKREKRERAAKQHREKRKARIEKLIADLSDLLQEPWRKIALEYYAEENNITTLNIIFKCEFVHVLLRPYMLAPSKMKKSLLQNIAMDINIKFSLIRDSGFLQLEFLKFEGHLDNGFESALRQNQLFSKIYASYETLVRTKGSYLRSNFFKYLEHAKPFDALSYLHGNNFGFLLVDANQSSESNSFLLSFASDIWKFHFCFIEAAGKGSLYKTCKITFLASQIVLEIIKGVI